MADSTVPPAPVKRRRWLRVLLGIVLGFFVLLVVLYFVLTSSAFFKGVLLPKVAKSMNATITVSEASISPFSKVALRDLKVQTTGPEPLLTAAEARARYHLMDIIGGKINVDEVTLLSPIIQIVQNPDGTSNLDPLTKSGEKEKAKPEKPAPSKPPEVNIKTVLLSGGTVRMIRNYKGGGRDVTEVSNVKFALDDVKNGQTGKLNLAADLRMDNNPPAPGTNGTLQAKIDGNFTFALSADLKPSDIKGQTHFTVEKAGGSLTDLAALGANFDCNVTPTEIKQVALRFQKGGAALGEILVAGPFDMEKQEGRLGVQVRSIDRQVLNLAGASQGIDFGSTTINSTNQIDLTKSGKVISAIGQLDASKFTATRTNQSTPPLDLRCVYNVTVNQDEKSALLRTLTMTGTQNQQPLLRAELASPMSLSWGAATNAVPDSTLSFAVTKLNLADWKPFLGDAINAGIVNVNLKLQSQNSGKQLVYDSSLQLDGLSAKAGTNQLTQVGVSISSRGQIMDLKKVNLEGYRLEVSQQSQPALTLTGSGQVDISTTNADLQLAMNSALPRLLQLAAQPDVNASSGTLELKSHITSQQQTKSVTATLTLADFTGRFNNDKFQSYGLAVDLDVLLKDQLLEIRKATGTLREGANPGGSFNVTGNFDSEKKTGQVTLNLNDLNQNALRPFLEAALGDKKLVSVSLNGNATAGMGPEGESSVKADVQVSKLVVNDPQNQLPATPLQAGLQADASVRKQVAEIRNVQLTLSPTQRAKNQLQLQGKVDMTQTNAFQGGLKLAAESLDVTSYYDLFANRPQAAPAKQPAPAATPAPTSTKPGGAPNQEPPATTLPFRNFPVDVNIGRFYLREIEITNWVTALRLDGGQINLNPLQMTINGAPVKATANLNLGVPGYQYDVSADGNRIPLEPVVNSLMPDKRGMYKGDLLLNTQIKGAGITGTNLQKNLAGQLNFSFTNANIQLVSKSRLKQFLSGVALFLATPELAESPLSWVDVRTDMGSGRIDFKGLDLVSPMFHLQTAGVMPIADVLTNSPFQNWPVNFFLSRSLAERVHLASAGANSTDPYVKLPNFLKVAGTLGTPKAQIDKTALAGTALEKLGEKIGLNEKTGGLLQGLGGIISGNKAGATNQTPATSTNQPPATNKPSPADLLDLFKKKK